MKCALCIVGMLREFEHAYDLIKQNIIEHNNNIDFTLFVNVWNERGFWVPGDSLNTNGIDRNYKLDTNYIKSIYNTDNINIEDFNLYNNLFEIEAKYYYDNEYHVESINHSNLLCRVKNTLSWFYKYETVFNNINNDFDLCIIMRPDLYIKSSYKLDINNLNRVHVLRQGCGDIIRNQIHGYNAIGDKFIYSSFNNMKNISKLYTNSKSLFNDELNNSHKIFDVHFYYYLMIQKHGLHYNNIYFNNEIMHTPKGEYKVNDNNDWVALNKYNYDKIDKFQGKCGE